MMAQLMELYLALQQAKHPFAAEVKSHITRGLDNLATEINTLGVARGKAYELLCLDALVRSAKTDEMSPLIEKSLTALDTAHRAIQAQPEDVLRATCFVTALHDSAHVMQHTSSSLSASGAQCGTTPTSAGAQYGRMRNGRAGSAQLGLACARRLLRQADRASGGFGGARTHRRCPGGHTTQKRIRARATAPCAGNVRLPERTCGRCLFRQNRYCRKADRPNPSALCETKPTMCVEYKGGMWAGRRFVMADYDVPDFLDGGGAYDHGIAGVMMIEAALQQNDPKLKQRYKDAALLAGEWAIAEPPVRNHNYTAKLVWLLAELYEWTGEAKYRTAMLDKLNRNLLPGVLMDADNDGQVDGMSNQSFAVLATIAQRPGRYWDGHNARPVYQAMNAFALIEAYVALRERGDKTEAARVKPYAFATLDNLAAEINQFGVPSSGYTMVPYALLLGLYKIAAAEKQPQPAWAKAFAAYWNARTKESLLEQTHIGRADHGGQWMVAAFCRRHRPRTSIFSAVGKAASVAILAATTAFCTRRDRFVYVADWRTGHLVDCLSAIHLESRCDAVFGAGADGQWLAHEKAPTWSRVLSLPTFAIPSFSRILCEQKISPRACQAL